MAATAESIRLNLTPPVRYVLRLADTALIHAQRLGEWTGHGPVLEEDIALTNMALDLVGQARALLTHAGRLEGQGFDEDQLAFLRDEGQFLNLTLAELPMRRSSAHAPGGDFADTVLRNFLLATWFKGLWARLGQAADADLAVTMDRSPGIRATLHESQRTLLIATALVMLVVFVFLGDARAAVIPCLATLRDKPLDQA